VKKFLSDAVYSELDDIDNELYDIEYDLAEMSQTISYRNRLSRRKFHIYEDEPKTRKRNRIRTKSIEFETL
jgi:hypothetical protein